jgi:hypothetical protein
VIASWVALTVTLAAVVSAVWDCWDRAQRLGGDDE